MSKSGHELWGLLDRNEQYLGVTQLSIDPETSLGIFGDDEEEQQEEMEEEQEE